MLKQGISFLRRFVQPKEQESSRMQKKIFIIAEAGVNHNGELALAKQLAEKAKAAGADAVKFQTFRTEKLVAAQTAQAAYQTANIGRKESQAEMLRRLELSYADFRELQAYCQEIGILFLSTAFDLDSIDFLASLDLPIWKIPSGEITNLPYLEKIAALKKPMIVSTGMAELEEIRAALEVLENGQEITVLHCTTEYPAPEKSVNLRAMMTLQAELGRPVGYSDHTEGIVVPIAAAAMGAVVLEKHFTLDKTMSGPDHKASLEPAELSEMVRAVRRVELCLGNGEKKPSIAELENRKAARKCIVAERAIAAGEIFTAENLTVKRAGAGISPMRWYEVLGKKAIKAFAPDERICLEKE